MDFFHTYGFAVLSQSLTGDELQHLNGWYERSQLAEPEDWGCQLGPRKEWLYHQPLLKYPELDPFVRHAGHFGVVSKLLGGDPHARFSEFDFRLTPNGTSQDRNWHRDIGDHGFGGSRPEQREQFLASHAHNYICSFHYLTDVTPDTPSLGVIPQSCVPTPLLDRSKGAPSVVQQLQTGLGEAFQELPLYAPAGSCIIYDISLFHARVNGTGALTSYAKLSSSSLCLACAPTELWKCCIIVKRVADTRTTAAHAERCRLITAAQMCRRSRTGWCCRVGWRNTQMQALRGSTRCSGTSPPRSISPRLHTGSSRSLCGSSRRGGSGSTHGAERLRCERCD
jgi:hypothetical protein